MTVYELVKALEAELVSDHGDKTITGYYAGDFLSNVMGRAKEGDAWFTVMTNVNVAGVAALTDACCVVICEGHKPDAVLVDRCREKGVILMTTELPVYEACMKTR